MQTLTGTPSLPSPTLNEGMETRTMAKVRKRLIPFLILCYFVAYLDRVNVGFAALTMNKDLGFSALVYSFGASVFFIGYFFFEVPSNYALMRVGARRWIARIMVTWGILSVSTMFVSGANSFYVLRFLLGAAEAGFFPGIILYLTFWFPVAYRARVVSLFMVAIPASTVIGAPISGWLLGLDGVAGFKGWQWLFMIEGVPSVVLGFVAWRYLTDAPKDASWLTHEERIWLETRLQSEKAQAHAESPTVGVWKTLTNPTVLGLGLIYFGLTASNYGLGFWLPQIVKGFGLSNVQTGFVTAIPFLCGAIAMVLWARHSDLSRERFWHVALPALLAGVGLAACTVVQDPKLTMIVLSIAAIGIFSSLPTFWTVPTTLLAGTSAAGGIALINSIANLSGFGGPYLVGWVKQSTGSFSLALLALAAFPFISALLVLAFKYRRRSPSSPPQAVVA